MLTCMSAKHTYPQVSELWLATCFSVQRVYLSGAQAARPVEPRIARVRRMACTSTGMHVFLAGKSDAEACLESSFLFCWQISSYEKKIVCVRQVHFSTMCNLQMYITHTYISDVLFAHTTTLACATKEKRGSCLRAQILRHTYWLCRMRTALRSLCQRNAAVGMASTTPRYSSE